MVKIGYARVSTKEQNPEMQISALEKAGCEKIFTEKESGRKLNRTVFNKIIRRLKTGDTLVVWKIDRLGRSISGICKVVDDLKNKGVFIESLTESINTQTQLGELFCKLSVFFAEIEISNHSERTIEGLNNARKNGKILGRPSKPKISIAQLEKIKNFRQSGLSVREISKKTNIPISSIYRYLKLKL